MGAEEPGGFFYFEKERWQGHLHLVARSGVVDFAASIEFEDTVVAFAFQEFSTDVDVGRAVFEDGVASMMVVCSRRRDGCGRRQINRWLRQTKPSSGWPAPDISPLCLEDEERSGHIHEVGRPRLPAGHICHERILELVSLWDSHHSQTGRKLTIAPLSVPDRLGMMDWLLVICAVSQKCANAHAKEIAGEPKAIFNIEEMVEKGLMTPYRTIIPPPLEE